MSEKINLCFATSNVGKLKEARSLLGPDIRISGLSEIGFTESIPETGQSFEENALQKIQFFNRQTGFEGFSEDSGLVIQALGGKPGIHTARYAGENATSNDNMALVLNQMTGAVDRQAKFVAVVALLYKGKTHLFTGEVRGKIAMQKIGSDGFGYDPIFIPNGYSKTFAEISREEKNKISHRRKALIQLKEFFNYE